MKAAKRITAVLLALVMAMSMCLTAFAAGGTTGTLTVTGNELTGKNVTVVRMFKTSDSDPSSYEMEPAWQDFFNKQLNKGTSQNATSAEAFAYVNAMKDDVKLVKFAKAAKDHYNANTGAFGSLSTSIAATAAVDGSGKGVATFNDLPVGYYLVLPASGSTDTRGTDAILANVQADKTNSVNMKSVYPTVDKTVEGGNSNSAQIGDTVHFALSSNVPDMSEYEKYQFIFHDTLSAGLTLDQSSIKVTIGGKDVTGKYEKTVTDAQGQTKLEIKFADLKTVTEATAGAVIKVEYSAVLNENAVVGGAGNSNEASLEYSNTPDGTGTGTTGEVVTKTYTFAMKVHKYANDDKTTILPGATFQLQDANGNPIKLVKVSATEYRVATAQDKSGVQDTFVTVADGDITISGLKEGTYKLVEKVAPEGYNKLTKPVEIVIKPTYGADGSLTKVEYTVNGGTASTDTTINVQNKNGAFLPETGSIGTIGLTVLGVLLVVGGLSFTSRKKKEQN